MISEYNRKLETLKEEYEKGLDKAFKESDRLYNEIAEKLGHKQFFSQGISKTIIECSKKYMQKFRKLDEKYNVNQNNK